MLYLNVPLSFSMFFYITTFIFMCEYAFCIHLWVHMSAHIQEGPKVTLCVFSFILFFNCWGRVSAEVRDSQLHIPLCPITPDILSLPLQCWDIGLPNFYLDAVFWTTILTIVQQMHYPLSKFPRLNPHSLSIFFIVESFA